MIGVNKIYNMDCLEGLKLLDDNSIDSIVTDPPYGLSKEPNIVEVLAHWLNDKEYKHPSKGFMGKEWDSFVPSPTIWKEVLRVLKPGGHLLCFAGTRTYDLMCMSIRLAGFEVRDMMQWIYGSGFPKSHNISKALDKKAGAEREVVGRNPNSRETYDKTKNLYELNTLGKTAYITTPATLEAKQWDGWGTALKPAHEPIVVARKSLSEKTIVDNILKWKTGGINIDDCRIEFAENDDPRIGKNYSHNAKAGLENGEHKDNASGEKIQLHKEHGRFPANIIFDEEAGKLLDQQSEIQASRFFYCAKASKKERGEGNNHPTVKPLLLIKYLITLVTPPKGVCLDPFEGSGTHALACMELGFNYIGFELDEKYYEIAKNRINQHVLDNKLQDKYKLIT